MCDFPGCKCYLGELDRFTAPMYDITLTPEQRCFGSKESGMWATESCRRMSHEAKYNAWIWLSKRMLLDPMEQYFIHWYEERGGGGGG